MDRLYVKLGTKNSIRVRPLQNEFLGYLCHVFDHME
ncbi:hypothetical protein NVIE_009340 [Nitrososphaera viennensis EN76]|uniref:Uncharacterized protein n=1 Tax=Nitrososphaera viennensis EN76 TaxID=926571 RepID=A0A060HER1_9ARCH|nr:hypothetical protein NVIE_009340 [Nitrososphaera viennensis EN76]